MEDIYPLVKLVPYNVFIGDESSTDLHLVKVNEIWRLMPEYDKPYMVSSFGRVSHFKDGVWSIKKIHLDYRGYQIVALVKGGKPICKKVHRLVAKEFILNSENKKTVNHKDFQKTNNTIFNLEWHTNKENLDHAYKSGVMIKAKGESQGLSKLTDKKVLEIRSLSATNTLESIGKLYNVHFTTIARVVNRETWKHI